MVGLIGDKMVFLLSVISAGLFIGIEKLLLKKIYYNKCIYISIVLLGSVINMIYLTNEYIHAFTIPFMVCSMLYFFKSNR